MCRHSEWEVLGSFRYLIMVNVFAALYASPASTHRENVISLLGTRKQFKIGWNIIHRGLFFQIITFRFSHLILPMHISQHTYRQDIVFVWIQTILGSFLLLKCARITRWSQ